MPKYREKTTVDAEQFWPDKRPWPEGVVEAANGNYRISTIHGMMDISAGWWVIRDAGGHRSICLSSYFEKMYEPYFCADDQVKQNDVAAPPGEPED